MVSPHRLSVALLMALGLACAALGSGGGATSEERAAKGDVRVIFPPDRAVLLSGDFDVIALADGGDLEVDGRAQTWEPFAPPLRVARVRLSPGLHELRIGSRRAKFAVSHNAEKREGPQEWEVYRSHPIQTEEKRCAACHKTSQRDGRTVVAETNPTTSCFDCHRTVDFEVKHSHPLEPLKPCPTCHALHGSPRKSLLKAPVKKLCAECHES